MKNLYEPLNRKAMKTKLSWANLSDLELIQLLQQGELRAFDILIRRHRSCLRNIAKNIVMETDQVDDLLQDGMLKIYQLLLSDKYADNGKFLPWACRIIRNLAIDSYRNKKSKKKYTNFDDLNIIQTIIPGGERPEEQLLYQELAQAVSALLEQLPECQKEVIRLRFFEELSFREIAEQTGTNLNTTLGRLRYGLKKLRVMLGSQNAA